MEQTLIDYDLNIYRVEEPTGDDELNPTYEYTTDWYVDIYEYLGNDHKHVIGPFPISDFQRDLLKLGQEGTYFIDNDSWYGLIGFKQDYAEVLTSELTDIFDALPVVKEDVAF